MLKSGIFHSFQKLLLTSILEIETSSLVYTLIVHSSFIYVAGLVISQPVQEQRASAGLACLIRKPSLPLYLMGAAYLCTCALQVAILDMPFFNSLPDQPHPIARTQTIFFDDPDHDLEIMTSYPVFGFLAISPDSSWKSESDRVGPVY